jgi:glycosyltransferase involved in cell wall biosynthesis
MERNRDERTDRCRSSNLCILMAKKLTVGLDRENERQSSTGVSRYSTSLAAAMSARDDVTLISVGGGALVPRGTLRKKLLTTQQDFWWYPYAGRRRAARAGADVYHCPSARAPVTHGFPRTVVTIQDLASFHYPETLTRWTRLYERRTVPHVAHACDMIIATSSDAATDIETILRIPSSKIRVVPLAVEQKFFQREAEPSPFSFPYVLFVGSAQPRKNLKRLAEAVARVSQRQRDLKLVIAGADAWGNEGNLGPNVTLAGRVDDDQLLSLYRHAQCAALVSLHEGFGLPVLEAMAAGTPVVASNVAALPEVSGGAAVLVDPLSVDAIADGIEEAIARRDNLVAAGAIRATQFTWARTAELTLAVYRELI